MDVCIQDMLSEEVGSALTLYYQMANINSALYQWAHNCFVLGATKQKSTPNYSVLLSDLNGVRQKAIGRSIGK